MRTLSIRTLAALAYERGEEFDPGSMPAPAVVEELAAVSAARSIVGELSPYDRRRLQEREHRACERVPDWFSPGDLFESSLAGASGALVHGELV